MSETVMVAPRRTFVKTFLVVMQISCARPVTYLIIALIVGTLALLWHHPMSLGFAVICGLIVAVSALLLSAAWQATHAARHERRHGKCVYLFDARGGCASSYDASNRILWSQMRHVKVTSDAWFIHVGPSAVWYFLRNELNPGDEAILLEYARAARLKIR